MSLKTGGTAATGAAGPIRRLIWRSRSRLILLALVGLVLYCMQQGPATGPPVSSGDILRQHRRAVLQRANSSSQQHQQQQQLQQQVSGDVSTGHPPHLPAPSVQSLEDREVRSVFEVDVPRAKAKEPILKSTAASAPADVEEVPLVEDYDVEELENELEGRRRRVREVCEATGLDRSGQPNSWEFFIDHRHHLVWCNIFKAASSTWMYNFNLLAGYKEDYLRRSRKTPLVLARARFPRPSVAQLKEALPSYMSFMIVRDPFERLLSAYRNKIEAFRHKFYRKMSREMIAKYRKAGSPYEGLKGPSFSEFVMHVVDTEKKPDEHWAPYYKFCTPCQVNFTVIAQVETLTRDQEYVIRHAGLAEELPLGRRGHREALNRARGAPTSELLERYFRQLSREQLLGLYRIYRIDFDMFGYDADRYFRMLNEPEPGIK